MTLPSAYGPTIKRGYSAVSEGCHTCPSCGGKDFRHRATIAEGTVHLSTCKGCGCHVGVFCDPGDGGFVYNEAEQLMRAMAFSHWREPVEVKGFNDVLKVLWTMGLPDLEVIEMGAHAAAMSKQFL